MSVSSVVDVLVGAPAGQIQLIPIEQLHPDPDNERDDLGDLTGLAASIREVGILQPLTVVPHPGLEGDYLVQVGHRRLDAAAFAELDKLPCIVRTDPLDASARRRIRLIENLHREDLTPINEARAFQELLDAGASQHEIAESLGCNQSHVSKRLKLIELPEDLAGKVGKKGDADGITVTDALEYARLADDPEQLRETIETRRSFESAKDAVDRAIADRERAAKQHAAAARLEADGIRRVERIQRWVPAVNASWDGIAVDLVILARTHQLDVDAHAELDCHAAAVTLKGDIEYGCTDPHAHPKKEVDRTESPEQIARREERAALEQAVTARREAYARLLSGAPLNVCQTLATRLLVSSMLDYVTGADVLPLLDPDTPVGDDPDEVLKAKVEQALSGRGDPWLAGRLLAVMAFMDVDPGPAPWGHTWTSRQTRELYAALQEAGYEPSPHELALLNPPAEDSEGDE